MAAYAGANNQTTLDGMFKERYADKMQRIIPEGMKLLNKINFLPKDKQPGNFYHQPVVLGMEHGVTFADPSEGAFELNPPIAGQIKDATVRGYQLVIRSVMSYQAASRAMGPGERAFEDATKFLVGSMLSSISKKLEIELLYGQKEYGLVEAVPVLIVAGDADFDPDSSPGNPAVGNYKVLITDAEFAAGIWAGAEGMPIEIYNSTLATLRASRTVKAVSLEKKAIAVDLSAGEAGTVVATDRILHKGAKNKEFAGIHKILTNTGSLFGIDSTQYTLWKGTEYTLPSVDVLSFAVIQSAIAKGVEKGLDTDVTVLVNPGHWDDLLTEQAALRMYDSSYSSKETENGAKTIKFHGQNGMVEIVPSIYVKEGYAYVLCMEDWVRVGSSDVTFKRPGAEGNFFRELEDHAGYELRAYTDQAVFCAKPGRQILIKNLKVS